MSPPFEEELEWIEPEAAFRALAGEDFLVWLDGAAEGDARSRYSYIAVDPFEIVADEHDPFGALARALARYRCAPGPLPFGGGAIGFFGYEAGRVLERAPARHRATTPPMVFGLFDVVVGFDLAARRCWIVASGLPDRDRARRAAGRIAWLKGKLAQVPAPVPAVPRLHWRAETDWPDYAEAIERLLGYIRAGDVYQANLTVRHVALRPPGLDPAAAYLALRRAAPAPFSAFLRTGPDLALASVSPERFLQLSPQGAVRTRPIKGTRARGIGPAADARARAALAASGKDRAEHLMIVDLLRNDLARVAAIGSVHVPSFAEVETFAAVHHLVSEVAAILRPGLGAVDLLQACFPGGSITGAPKIRAMEVIDALEPAARGPYCGTIAWIGFDGAMDSSIVIRTVVIGRATLLAQAGGAIVGDSTASAEYREMQLKLSPLLGPR